MFLENIIPERYLSDSDTAGACAALGILAWNLGILKNEKRLSPFAPVFLKGVLALPEYKELAEVMEGNFQEVLDLLSASKQEDFAEYHDFITAWTMDVEGDQIPDDQFPVLLQGCASSEIDTSTF